MLIFQIELIFGRTHEKISFHTIDHVRTIFDSKGNPSKTLQSILNLFTINHDGLLKTIVKQTQKNFLRQAGKERWEIEDEFIRKIFD